MQHLKNGVMLFLVALLASFLLACNGTIPPRIVICTGDGYGGADCIEKDGARKYRGPSELENFWMTDQESMSEFSAWCYRTKPSPLPVEVGN